MSLNDKITVEISETLELKNPKLICGLPGSGFVGKIAVDYLVEKLNGSSFAKIFSSSLPPQVLIQSDGTVDLVKNTLYHLKHNEQDFVILTGDAQPVSVHGEYTLAEKILDICKKLNVIEVYTLAAYITGNFAKTPKVFATATTPEIVKKLQKSGVKTLDRGNITGMNGVMIGIAKRNSIPGICLLGETSGYVIDAKASKAVLEVLCKMLNIDLDMSDIESRAKDTEEIIKTIHAQASSQNLDQEMRFQQSEKKNLGYIS